MQTDDYYVRNYNRDNDVCVWKQKNVGYYESSELSLFEIGVEKCTPGFDWGPDRKGFHTLHYVFSGKGSLMVNDRYFEISAGQVFYIASNDFAYYKADAEMPWKYIWIRYFGTKASIIMNFTSLPDRFVMNDTADGFVNCSLNAILKAVMKDSSVNMYSLTGLLYCFLGGLVDRFPKKDTQIDSSALGYLDALIDYIHLNYAKPNVITGMAHDRNLSRSYIYKLFRQYLDVSPSEYLDGFRIGRACSYLKETNAAISDIAHSVGYSETASFFRAFKRKTGMTPHEYRVKNSI